MIFNLEQNNQIEGSYIYVQNVKGDTLVLNTTKNFEIPHANNENWLIGWGNGFSYNDAGCENLGEFQRIAYNQFLLRKTIRGEGKPCKGKHIVFWNNGFDNFKKLNDSCILKLSEWKEFAGKSVCFGDIVKDKNHWFIFFQECDTIKRQIYLAKSINLTSWNKEIEGQPLLNYKNFKNIGWAAGNYINKQTPYVTDVLKYGNLWYLILTGLDKNNTQTIGICYSKSILGPYKIHSKSLIEIQNSWNSKGNFAAEICYYKGVFLMAFDGVDENNNENVGFAYSANLFDWEMDKKNPKIAVHNGWRSKLSSSEPNYIYWSNNKITLILSGNREFSYNAKNSLLNAKNLPGNVDDAQLGLFYSLDNGKTFKQHENNPIIVNDYADDSENEHMGGNIKWIEYGDKIYFFYQVKTIQNELKYSIYLRIKQKKYVN
jgi:hypothetical protein